MIGITQKEPFAACFNTEADQMTAQLPILARADADGEGPPKRTRRPALSCVECRMRKVKCDRKEPCGACIRIKSEKCTYRPTRAGIRRGAEKSPSTSESNNAQGPARPSPQSSLLAERTILNPILHADTGSSALVAVLLRENERLQSSVSKGASASHEGDTRPISEVIADFPGTFQKSKFFGQSHWMNAMEPVSHPDLP